MWDNDSEIFRSKRCNRQHHRRGWSPANASHPIWSLTINPMIGKNHHNQSVEHLNQVYSSWRHADIVAQQKSRKQKRQKNGWSLVAGEIMSAENCRVTEDWRFISVRSDMRTRLPLQTLRKNQLLQRRTQTNSRKMLLMSEPRIRNNNDYNTKTKRLIYEWIKIAEGLPDNVKDWS